MSTMITARQLIAMIQDAAGTNLDLPVIVTKRTKAWRNEGTSVLPVRRLVTRSKTVFGQEVHALEIQTDKE